MPPPLPMDATPGILLLTANPETERAVSAALAGEQLRVGAACRSIQELVGLLRRQGGAVKAAVVDIEPAPEKTLAMLDPVISRFAETRFVILARSPGQELLLEAMQIGARHVVASEALSRDLPPVLRRIAVNGSARRGSRGLVVSILSASGGTGATLLATNLAFELHLLSPGATLLVDLDLFSGAVASYLNVHADYDLASVLSDADRLDGELIKSSSALHDQNLYILLSPGAGTSRRAGGGGVHFEHLPRLMQAAKESFEYVVIDAPRLPLETAAQVAGASTLTIVPFQLSVVGIRAAKNLIGGLIDSGVPGDQIMPIASRHRRRRVMIGLDEAARALGRGPLGYLSNDFKPALTSVNLGQPLAVAARRSKIRRDIERLAEHIHKAHVTGAHPAPIF